MDTEQQDFPEGVAVVIGGSGGIGAAICETLAKAGCDIMLSYRSNQQKAEMVVESVKALGQEATSMACSAQDLDSCKAFFEATIERFGRIHTVVNAAGSSIPMRFIGDLDPELWHEVIDADLHGFFNIMHSSLPHLRLKGGGSYVQISSIGMQRWPKRDVLSVAPKAGIEALLQGIAREEGRSGIRANSVQLGVIEAGMFLRLKAEGGDFTPEWVEAAKENTALKRFGTAEDIANAVCFLASSRSSYITGQVLKLDGGFSI